jgi:hypothetical protein
MRIKYTLIVDLESDSPEDVENFIENNMVSCKHIQIKNVEMEEDTETPIEERPYIYERNPDTGEIFRRRALDYHNRECINPSVNSVPNL